MHRYKAKAVLLLLAGALALGLVALAWTIGPGSSEAQQGAMHNCPQAGKWAISVWDGADGTDTSEALATCGQGAVDFAYYIDPDTQAWLRYFAARTDISNLLTLNNMQGVLAYGAVGAPPLSPTPLSTPTPVAGVVSAKEGYPLALQVARARHPDAYLEWVRSGCNSALLTRCYESSYEHMASGDGRSEYWHFSFYLPTGQEGQEGFMVDVVGGQPTDGYYFGSGGVPDRLALEEMMDSTEAVRIADAHGGSAYEAASPGNRLCGAQIFSSQWQIDYCPPFEEGGTGLAVWVDGRTGQVTETEEPEWH